MTPRPSPTLLAIDTAGARCSLALLQAGRTESLAGAVGRTHLEHVLPMIEEIFARCALRPQDCDAFAFASGPGSFTGLRVACTVVQGLALGAGKPVIAVGHFDALLQAACTASAPVSAPLPVPSRSAQRALVLLDARMQQAYWAGYEERVSGWQLLAAPAVGDRDELLGAAEHWQPDFYVGDAAWIHGYIGAVPVRDATVDAAVIARLAQQRYARGVVLAPERAFPEYVRDRVAQTVVQRRAGAFGRPA